MIIFLVNPTKSLVTIITCKFLNSKMVSVVVNSEIAFGDVTFVAKVAIVFQIRMNCFHVFG